MSLVALANHLAEKGRGDDKMLVHMTPGEVQGLQALAMAHGGSLTVNPDTGLVEAGWLKKLLPAIAGFALNFIAPGVGTAIGSALGMSGAVGTGLLVGGVTGLATGSLRQGIMAGLGAYGGASLAGGLQAAGASAAQQAAVSEAAKQQAAGVMVDEALTSQGIQNLAAQQATKDYLAKGALDKFTGGIGALGTEAGRTAALQSVGGASGLMKFGLAAAAPVIADAMVPTTTPMPSSGFRYTPRIRPMAVSSTGQIEQLPMFSAINTGQQTQQGQTAGVPGAAQQEPAQQEPGGYNGGGIVALAAGGATEQQIRGLYQDVFKREADPGGLQFWQQSGYTPDQIRAEFLKSPEYTSMQGRQAIPYAQGNAASQQDITNAYYSLLGRAPDQGGLAFYQSSQFSPEQIRQNIMQSPEYQAFQAGPKTQTQLGAQAVPYAQGTAATQDEIKNIYKQLLRREADVGGLEFYGASRFSPEQIRQEIMKSEEFRGLPAFVDEPAPEAFKPTAPTMQEVRTTYEQGGGSTQMPSVNVLGANERPMTQNAVVDKLQAYLQANPTATGEQIRAWGTANGVPAAQLNAAINERRFSMLTGGSKSAYDYLMGRGAYPVNQVLPGNAPLMRPYYEAVGLTAPVFGRRTIPTDPNRQTSQGTTGGTAGGTTGGTAGGTTGGTAGGTAGTSYTGLAASYFAANPDVKSAFETQVSGMTPEEYVRFHWNTFGRAEGRQGFIESQTAQPANPATPGGGGATGGDSNADILPFNVGGITALAGAARGGQFNLGSYSDGGRLLRGPGDGVSDSIPAVIGKKQPARLADGEFVIPARIVSEIGNGSTEAGARKLYAMMDRVQRARAKTTGKGKVAKNTRADKYLPA